MNDINNTIVFGDSEYVLKDMDTSVQLCVTSPPYYLMRGEVEYDSYRAYLKKMFRIFKQVHRVLDHGRICVVNSCDYMSDGVKYPVPFDLHGILRKIGFTYLDDIIWRKPHGMSSSKRGGVLIQNPYPMYFYPDTIYEHIMIFSKGKGRPLDHVNKDDSMIDVLKYHSFIHDIWSFPPQSRNSKDLDVHRSAYPIVLPEMIARFYSYVGETVLDPFGGHFTTMRATSKLRRSCTSIELFKQREQSIKRNVRYGQTSLDSNIIWKTITHPSANLNPIPSTDA